jgi:hypothetical protein
MPKEDPMSESDPVPSRGRPWHLWVIGILAVLWNAVGAYDYAMTQTQNEAYMSRFTAAQLEYFYGFPAWVDAFWAVAVWGGVLGALLLLARKRVAASVLLASLVAMVVTSLYNFVLSEGVDVMGSAAMAFSAVIFVVAVALWLYARGQAAKGILV